MKTNALAALFLMLPLGIHAQRFELKGNVHTKEYDGLTIYLNVRDVIDRDKTVRLDSCIIADGQYSFSVAAPDSLCWAVVALPPKDHHFVYGLPELSCIVEPGKVEADCEGFTQTLRGGTLNQQYDDLCLCHDREVRAKVDAMMKQREEAEKHHPYTDAENDAYSQRLAALYQGNRKYMEQFVAANIGNPVGAHLLLTYGKSYFSDGFYDEMCAKVNPAYLRRAEARDRAALEAQRQAEQARQATKAGNPYKDFASLTTDGKAVRFSDYVEKGKVTLLDFWASWCGPCILESKELKKLYADYHAKGFNIVSVSLDSNKQKWLDAIAKHQLPWTHISSLKAFKDPGALAYAVSAIPYVVLIDRDGNILLQNMHGPVLHAKIKELFK